MRTQSFASARKPSLLLPSPPLLMLLLMLMLVLLFWRPPLTAGAQYFHKSWSVRIPPISKRIYMRGQ